MEVSEYIRSEINKHLKKYKMRASNEDIDEMIIEVLNGTYAFQIIYDEIYNELDDYKLHSFIPIDYKKIVVKEESLYNAKVYSYDGGKRFQWFEKETLIFDNSIIRDIKLNKIIKD